MLPFRKCTFALAVLLTALLFLPSEATLRAGPVGIVTLGDSLTDTYAGKPYAGSNQSWTDLVTALRGNQALLTNLAKAGATSIDLVGPGQLGSAVQTIQQGQAHYATIMIGANNIGAYLANMDPNNLASFDPTPYVQTLAGNVNTAITALKAAGAQGIVLTNLPDIGQTPALQYALAGQQQVLQLLTLATQAANASIEALAAQHQVPLVDLHGLNQLAMQPLNVGGLDVQQNLYSVDGFHPSTIGSGLLANAQMEAVRKAFGVQITPLSDSEILAAYGLSANDPTAAFDVSSFVKAETVPEPTSLTLLLMGAAGMAGAAYRRRRKWIGQ